MRGGLTAALLVVACALALPCRAMSVAPQSFDKLVSGAESILRVKVTAVNCRWNDAPGHGRVIHTFVQCRVLRTLKGAAGNTVTLRLLGGQVGNIGMRIPDMPEFDVGGTYIVFVAGNGRAFCPLVGVRYGVYRIVSGRPSGSELIMRADGTPLLSASDVQRPMEQAPAAGSPAMSREAFEAAILSKLRQPPRSGTNAF